MLSNILPPVKMISNSAKQILLMNLFNFFI